MPTWEETRLYIENTLEDFKEWHKEHNIKLEQITAKLAALERDIALLKQKAALIGFLSGLLASALVAYIFSKMK